jgi:ribonuclease BN (tRNA processing enzyme)
MKLRILGSAGAEMPGFRPPAYLIDDVLLLDAGTIGAALGEDGQAAIRDILVTHSHLDHVGAIPALAANLVMKGPGEPVTVAGSRETIASIRDHLLNGVLWADFTRIPDARNPVLRYREIAPGVEERFGAYAVTAWPVHHSVPAVGYVVRDAKTALLYTGDTGPTDRIWEAADGVAAMIVEVSFPNAMDGIARTTCHMTARMLAGELAKVRKLPPKILVTHPKPQYYDRISSEIGEIAIPGLTLLRDGDVHML